MYVCLFIFITTTLSIMKRLFCFWIITMACLISSAQIIVNQDFENGLEGWQAVSMNTNNDYYFGFNHLQTTAHSGSNYFQFSSYYSASDYNQYLISPNLNLSSEAIMSYFCRKAGSNGTESFQIMVSTTDNAITSFSPVGKCDKPYLYLDRTYGNVAGKHPFCGVSLHGRLPILHGY